MKKAIIGGLVFSLLAVLGCYTAFQSYKRNPEPALADYNASLKIPGLQSGAHVYRGDYGEPHIFAENEEDLFFAIGYTQAQDRLWEMVLLRAFAEGRLSEILGPVKVPGARFKGLPIDTVVIDEMMRTFGLKHIGEVGASLLKEKRPRIHNQLDAYARGVNHYIDSHREWEQLPVEFQMLKVKPGKFRPADVVSAGRLMGFLLTFSWQFELFRYGVYEKYGEDVMWEAAPIHDHYGPTIVPPELLENKLSEPRNIPPGGRPPQKYLPYPYDTGLSSDAAMKTLAALGGIQRSLGGRLPYASNKWILAGNMTESGTPMLGNDTHLPTMQPSIWYMSHVKGAGIDSYGVMLPGTPYHALGHTKDLAWAATTSIADVQDLYLETVDEEKHPGKYLHKGEWKPFTVRKEVIKIRQVPSQKCIKKEIDVRQTLHGPVITDYVPLPEGSPPVTMRWTAWDFCRNQKVFEALITSATVDEFMDKADDIPDEEFELMNVSMALDTLMRGKSIEDFKKAMDQIVVPSQNWSAADSSGNIAYLPGGLVPVRNKGLGVMPVPGASGEWDWTGFIPLTELPSLENPDRGYILSANNEVVDLEWYEHVFSTNYDGGWRAMRVEELIKELAPIDMEDMKKMQNDVFVPKAHTEVPLILAAIEEKGMDDPRVKKGYEQLKAWDFEADLDSTATAVFFKWAEEMRRNIFADEMDKEDFELFIKGSNGDLPVEIMMKKGHSPAFDDKTTEDKVEDMNDMIVRSVRDAVAFLEDHYGKDPSDWRWGDVHPIKFYHPLSIWPFEELSVGPFPHVGSRHTLRCASPQEDGKWHFKATYGPAWRHLIDLGDTENAQVVIDGSISGQYLSPHYRDLHQVWLEGDHLTGTMDPAKIKAEAKYHMQLKP